MKRLSIVLFSILFFLLPQKEFTSREELEQLVKDFLLAVYKKDKEKILSLCTYEDDIAILWAHKKLIDSNQQNLEELIHNSKISWFKVGDEIRLGKIKYIANRYMINQNRKVVLPHLKRFAGPIQLTKINNQWKIQPYWFILNEKGRIKEFEKKGEFTHSLEINGIPYQIILNKGSTIQLPNGEKLFLKLKEVPNKIYKNQGISFSYSSQLHLKTYQNQNSFSIVLNSKLSHRILIEISKNDKSISDIIDNTMNTFIRDYQRLNLIIAQEKNNKFFEIIDQEKVFGQRLYTKIDDNNTQIDCFFCFKKYGMTIFISYHCSVKDLDLMNDFFSLIKETMHLTQDINNFY